MLRDVGKELGGGPVPDGMSAQPQLDAERIFREAAERYIAERRAAVRPFVDRHFSRSGTLRLHRAALGWDIIRAPINLALAIPNLVAKIVCAWMRRYRGGAPAWLDGRDLLLRTAVDREIEWLVYSELLELPFSQGKRSSGKDALSEAVMLHSEVETAINDSIEAIDAPGRDPEIAAKLAANLERYTGSRAATADITTAFSSIGAGALFFQQLTPSALSLGPATAALLDHHWAVASFPLGETLGGVWYGIFPPEPSAELVAGMTGGLVLTTAILAAFAGVLADPVQRALGIHHRRLNKLIDALESDLVSPDDGRFAARAHYIARLIDFFEGMGAVYRAL